MIERQHLLEWLRGEVVGPSRWMHEPNLIEFNEKTFVDLEPARSGPLAWLALEEPREVEEVLYYDRESPHRKYGVGCLHPQARLVAAPDQAAIDDRFGAELRDEEIEAETREDEEPDQTGQEAAADEAFDITSPDVRFPSTMGLSLCASFDDDGILEVTLPASKKFAWQTGELDQPFKLNGRYEQAHRHYTNQKTGKLIKQPIWRRVSAVGAGVSVEFQARTFKHGQVLEKAVELRSLGPLKLIVEVFPRKIRGLAADSWMLTVVLRNVSPDTGTKESLLFQTLFEVAVNGGTLRRYPESQRPFSDLDDDEKSLSLLYRDSATWGIGHGCATAWDDAGRDAVPAKVWAEVLPTVELPSMTPDITDRNGKPLRIQMRTLAELDEDGNADGWTQLQELAGRYENWIEELSLKSRALPSTLQPVATDHIKNCLHALERVRVGIQRLREDSSARRAFRLANLAMLLQQIGTKKLKPRSLLFQKETGRIVPSGKYESPWKLYQSTRIEDVGIWRAFQVSFLLMSLDGITNPLSEDREIVDLIWFPTGGGKTEAYLGVAAFYLFYERISHEPNANGLRCDGTNVLMRYTLRMLTTQQFQRAASLICSMEILRRHSDKHGLGNIPGDRFSLGLWIGRDGSPNDNKSAEQAIKNYRAGEGGNPLVLTECPWCRSEIGRYRGSKPTKVSDAIWKQAIVTGISTGHKDGPRLFCPDPDCPFGQEEPEEWLPIEVIDERIYDKPPSIIIGTVDKFAMIAYRPRAGSIFGKGEGTTYKPPGLIIQDELHLISGPLGTMYAFYECLFESLCTARVEGYEVKPKIISSTATIRGAREQIRALYARGVTRLFPPPGLSIDDSFFGTYAKDSVSGELAKGRLYVGVHANEYGSILTTQVRVFSSLLYRAYFLDETKRDPYWTLLAFYNSLRELGGAKTLFDSDIRSRLRFLFNRDGHGSDRRSLRVQELTSRLSQPEIVAMMDTLSTHYSAESQATLDACLASSIIEVGVDIDRLSLMGVVGQPKTTAQYIQVTGRVGRKWWERPGLIVTVYNPSKSRDRSHYEHFQNYHRRLYERVEPASATPFAVSAIQRALPGAIIAWARQHSGADVSNYYAYEEHVISAFEHILERCTFVQTAELEQERSIDELKRVLQELTERWQSNPQEWEEFPPTPTGEYLMLWPGQFSTLLQKTRGVPVATSMRNVDATGELEITDGYAIAGRQQKGQI